MFRRNKDDDNPATDAGENANLRLGLTNADSTSKGKDAGKSDATDGSKTDPSAPAPLRPFARKGTRGPSSPTTLSAATVQSTYRTPSGTEIPRRPVDMGRAPSRATRAGASSGSRASASGDGGKRLTVGREISLTGEISACDTLVVEGRVEAHLSEARVIEVAQSGVFRGQVKVQDADISGLCEGELTVTGTLIVRDGGQVEGKTRYGTLVVEAGGRICGQIEAIETEDDIAAQDEPDATDDAADASE